MLHRFRYNLLALVQVGSGAANVLLLYAVYGGGDTTAVFLIALSIVGSLQLLLLMMSDQFVFHYLKLKLNDPARAETSFAAMLAIVTAGGALSAVVVHAFAPWTVSVFAKGFTGPRLSLATDLLEILSLSLVFGSLSQMAQARLSALGRIGWSYVLTILPQLLQAAVLVGGLARSIDVRWLAWTQPSGQALAVGLGLLTARPTFQWSALSLRTLKTIIADSIRVRLAHNIHNFFSLYLINLTLSGLPTSLSSVFLLVKRGTDTLLTIVSGPLQKVLTNEVGEAMHKAAYGRLTDRLRALDRRLPIVFAVALPVGLGAVLVLRQAGVGDATQLHYGAACFVLLLLQTALIATEMPYALVSLALNRSRVFYVSNTVFLAALSTALFLLKEATVNYALPIALVFAQSFNFFIIRRAGRAALRAE